MKIVISGKTIPVIKLLALPVLLGMNCMLYAQQQEKTVQDSTIIKQDSVIYNSIEDVTKSEADSSKYKAIEEFSRRTKLTKLMHKAFFHPIFKEKTPPPTESDRERSDLFKVAQGKIIRKIRIVTLDPFGYSIYDTSASPKILPVRAANWVHGKTNSSVIHNLLLLRENQVYDSLKIKESERLVRSRKYIRDVMFTVMPASADSVDINIRAVDVWSLIPSIRRTSSQFFFGVTDLNFAGFGNSLTANTWWKKPDNDNITYLRYQIPNFRNTYININIQYLFSLNSSLRKTFDFRRYFYYPVSYNPQYLFSDNRNIVKSIEAERPFYSPFTKWAGGIFLGQMMTTQTFINLDTLRYLSSYTNIIDYWVGRSWKIDLDETGSRITNIVLTSRVVKVKIPSRPQEAINANIFNTHRYFFGGISLSSRKYVLDKYIFNYGKTEDVPEGKIIGITVGIESQLRSRYYLGINAGWGGYNAYGYLGTHLSYGTFKGQTGFQEGIFTGRINYFTKLLTLGDWKLRQFVRTSFIFGINRFPADNLPLKIGIKGFEDIESRAMNITVVSLQTQSYAPWDLAGFHFGPFFFAYLGFLKGEPMQVRNNKFYSLLGFGVLIKNDYLMFNTFQVSLSFYPFIPGNGSNIFRANGYKTSDYGFRDFETTKPGIVD
jgi:hypothetical protein